jgi:hypothetical protein
MLILFSRPAYHLGITAVKLAADDFDFGLEVEGGLAAKVRKYYGVESTADAPSRVVSQPERIV